MHRMTLICLSFTQAQLCLLSYQPLYQNPQPPHRRYFQITNIGLERCSMYTWLKELQKFIMSKKRQVYRISEDLDQYQYIVQDFLVPLKSKILKWKRSFCPRCRQNYEKIYQFFNFDEQIINRLIDGYVQQFQRISNLKNCIRFFSSRLTFFKREGTYCIPQFNQGSSRVRNRCRGNTRNRSRFRQQ